MTSCAARKAPILKIQRRNVCFPLAVAKAAIGSLEARRRFSSGTSGKIVDVRTTPVLVKNIKPYHWAHGIIHGASMILVEVETEDGVIGYGESIATPSAEATAALIKEAVKNWKGRSVFESRRLAGDAYHALFQGQGNCSAKQFGGLVLAGPEMALWDAAGHTVGRPVYELLGGKVHDELKFFGFLQGDTAEELAEDAKKFVAAGFEVIYVKLGRGDMLDVEIVRKVRQAIGPSKRLRVDPNEMWDPLRCARMIREIEKAGGPIEFVEQPVTSDSISTLAQVRAESPVAIAADQCVYTPSDVLEVVKLRAADVVTLGLHETGGINRFLKCAAVAEAAGINICIHGLHETGITTCATIQAMAAIPNVDDGNQYMNHLIEGDLIANRSILDLREGKMPIPSGPGLGFQIDLEAIRRAAEAFKEAHAV